MKAVRGFAAAVLLLLWLTITGTVVVEAADPPYVPPPPPGYVAWDDNLLSQKLAPIYQGDPAPYVTRGRFYDVGRNPEPISPPANPLPTDYGDWRFRVTHIKFDWKNNASVVTNPDGTLSTVISYDEAQTMMWDIGGNLKHVRDNKVKGEWIYKYATFEGEDAGRSEPALYVTDKLAILKVRIECANPVKYAYVGAKELRPPYPSSGPPSSNTWLDVKKTAVAFRETTPGSNIWVSWSRVQVGVDGQGNPIYEDSEYVDLVLDGTTKSIVDRSDIVWQWYIDRVNDTDELAQANPMNEWTAAVVCLGNKDGWAINKSGEYAAQDIVLDDGTTQTVEVVLPHRFYTILDRSKYPWYDARDGSDAEGLAGNRKPWATALDFAIVSPRRIKLRGYSSISAVATRVTEFFYGDFGLNYAHDGSEAAWVYTAANTIVSPWVSVGVFEFDLTRCMGDVNATINCHDQALAVTMLTALIGGESKYTTMEPFGYVLPSDFVGDSYPEGNDCNNPFFGIVGTYPSVGKVGDDDTIWRFDPIVPGLRKRSMFSVHAWMEMSSVIFDATAGAANSHSPRTGLTRAAFKTAFIDLTHTAVNPWEDNEELAADIDDNGVMVGPKKLRNDAPDPNYKNGDMDKATYRRFTFK